MEFHDKLKAIMSALGVRSSALSKRMLADPATVSRWRSGARPFSQDKGEGNRLAECLMSFVRSERQQKWLANALADYEEQGLATAEKLALWLFDGREMRSCASEPAQAAGVCFPGVNGFLTAVGMLEHAVQSRIVTPPLTVYIASEKAELLLDAKISRSLWQRLYDICHEPVRVILEQSGDADRLGGLLSSFMPYIRAGRIILNCVPGVERYFFYNLTVLARGAGMVVALEPPAGKGEPVSLFLEDAAFVSGTASVLSSLGEASIPVLKLVRDAGEELRLTRSCYDSAAVLSTRFGCINPLYADEESYGELLKANQLSYETRKYRMRRFIEMRQAFERFLESGRYRTIVSLAAIEELMRDQAISMPDLSFSEESGIVAPASFAAGLLRGMMNFLNRYPNLELLLVTDQAVVPELLFLKEDSFLLLKSSEADRTCAYSDNWILLHEYEKQFESLWRSGKGVFGKANVLYTLSRKLQKMEGASNGL